MVLGFMNRYARIKIRVTIFSLLKLHNNFPQKFVLSRYVIFKAYEMESKQGITVGKAPLHLLSVMQSVHPDGFRGKRVTRMGSHFFRILGVKNSDM